jgi:hypothetical protein
MRPGATHIGDESSQVSILGTPLNCRRNIKYRDLCQARIVAIPQLDASNARSMKSPIVVHWEKPLLQPDLFDPNR